MAKFFLFFFRLFLIIFCPCGVAIRARKPETFNTEWRPLFESVRFVIIIKLMKLDYKTDDRSKS
jgi:hypothetical protein